MFSEFLAWVETTILHHKCMKENVNSKIGDGETEVLDDLVDIEMMKRLA